MEIVRATPIDYYEIVLEFSDGLLKKFGRGLIKLPDHYAFLSFPNKLKAFRMTPEGLTWYNGTFLGADFLYTYSVRVEHPTMVHASLFLGLKNNAPTGQHARHHEYRALVMPFNLDKPIMLCESIGGGFADSGGCTSNPLHEILKMDWKEHFRKSDCEWAIDIINTNKKDVLLLIDKLVEAVCKQHFTTVKD